MTVLGIVLGLTLLSGAIGLVAAVAEDKYKSTFDKEKNNLLFVIQYLLNTILDNDNTIKINLVVNELKYWGLTKAQVDFILSNDNNVPRGNFTPFSVGTEIPPIPSAEELGINENEHEILVNAREASIEQQGQIIAALNEEYNVRGYILFDIDKIKEFILKAGENKEVLAPNGNFSDNVIKFRNHKSNNYFQLTQGTPARIRQPTQSNIEWLQRQERATGLTSGNGVASNATAGVSTAVGTGATTGASAGASSTTSSNEYNVVNGLTMPRYVPTQSNLEWLEQQETTAGLRSSLGGGATAGTRGGKKRGKKTKRNRRKSRK